MRLVSSVQSNRYKKDIDISKLNDLAIANMTNKKMKENNELQNS